MKILSIIVPSYNTSRFIVHFFDSIIDERYNKDIEILIVNDGSSDDTSSIAHQFEHKYPDTVVVIDKDNGGHGSAINVGIKCCKGKYFKVVDGDDFVDKNALFGFIEDLKAHDSDMFINPYTTISEKTNKSNVVDVCFSPYCKRKIERLYQGSVLQIDKILPYIYASIHALTFKTSIFIDNNITLTERVFYEDNEYNLFALPFIQTVFYSTNNVYRYLIDQSNQSISLINAQKRVSHLEQIVVSLTDFYVRNKKVLSKPKQEYIERVIVSQIQSVFRVYLSFNDNLDQHKKELKEFDFTIRRLSRVVFKKSNRKKVVFFTRFFSYAFYKLLCSSQRSD